MLEWEPRDQSLCRPDEMTSKVNRMTVPVPNTTPLTESDEAGKISSDGTEGESDDEPKAGLSGQSTDWYELER